MLHQKGALLVFKSMPWVVARNNCGCWEMLKKGGRAVLEKPVAQTSSPLCGHKAAPLSSRLFNSKQLPSEGKHLTSAAALARRFSLGYFTSAAGAVAGAEQAGDLQKEISPSRLISKGKRQLPGSSRARTLLLLPPLLLLAWGYGGMRYPRQSVCEGVRHFFKYTTETSAGLSLFAK